MVKQHVIAHEMFHLSELAISICLFLSDMSLKCVGNYSARAVSRSSVFGTSPRKCGQSET